MVFQKGGAIAKPEKSLTLKITEIANMLTLIMKLDKL